jgi:hypothetical protein
MKQDRFLLGILIGIGALVVLALVMFFLRQETRSYIADDVPEGVVHNYVLALHEGDYQKAYEYLADAEYKPDFETFRNAFLGKMVDPSGSGIQIGRVRTAEKDAYVDVTVVFAPSDAFSSRYSSNETALLVLQDGKWKLRQMPYSFWMWGWYEKPYE